MQLCQHHQWRHSILLLKTDPKKILGFHKGTKGVSCINSDFAGDLEKRRSPTGYDLLCLIIVVESTFRGFLWKMWRVLLEKFMLES